MSLVPRRTRMREVGGADPVATAIDNLAANIHNGLTDFADGVEKDLNKLHKEMKEAYTTLASIQSDVWLSTLWMLQFISGTEPPVASAVSACFVRQFKFLRRRFLDHVNSTHILGLYNEHPSTSTEYWQPEATQSQASLSRLRNTKAFKSKSPSSKNSP
ncbi:hypothetical protein C8Q74DRAFT_1218816 [Fomes fomentarius]|nr:hypothetical protein C8Q74DRAFT_1218816 [Fomes fomentarius]